MPQPPLTPLNGATLLRFVRGYATGAGLEYDVEMINQALCERHELRILQIHMALPGESLTPREMRVGRGRVTTIPLPRPVLSVGGPKRSPTGAALLGSYIRRTVRDQVLFNPLTGQLLTRWFATRRPVPRPGDVKGVGSTVRQLLKEHRVTLVVVHAAGGADSWEAIDEARCAGVPVAVQLHYANERFKDLSVRVQVARVDRIGGVSDVNLPPFLIGHFSNLLTAVDIHFFSRRHTPDESRRFKHPVLVLPARIVPSKGHDDLLEIVKILHGWGLTVDVAFAGRPDQPEYEGKLRTRITDSGFTDRFHFLGLLNPEQLRNLYSTCAVLAFPTYHQEGLPRILLEAQAMELPVVVYDSGGSRAGLIPDKTGYLVAQGDKSAFANAIRCLLRTPTLAKAFGQKGRQFVERDFALGALADRHERFIDEAIESYRSRQVNRASLRGQ